MDPACTVYVVLRDDQGRYLAGRRQEWAFTADSRNACVFDYVRDRIPEQLESLRTQFGIVLIPIPVESAERYEVCDRCGRRALPFRVFFDGRQYLCAECRELLLTPGSQIPNAEGSAMS
jgi:hypothetical protein